MTRRWFVSLCALLLITSGCTASVEIDNTQLAEAADSPTVTQVEPTAELAEPTTAVDPTPTPTPLPTTVIPTPTEVPATPTPTPTRAAVADVDHSGLAGARGLTLQWISWEPADWGRVEFVPLVDGTYAVAGRQDGPDGDYVEVDGVVIRQGDRELLFTGTVTVRVSYTNNGEPCVRSGDISFLATGDRRFWRMQDLLNCDGIVTDYVDIYFG